MKKKYLCLVITFILLGWGQMTAQTGCSNLAINSTQDGAVCGGGYVELTATPSGTGDDVLWYDSATDTIPVGYGSTFVTPYITSTTNYWVAEVMYSTSSASSALLPDLMYYQFNNASSIQNTASSPVGTNPATIQGNLTVGGTGMTGTALQGTGSSGSSNVVQTGWNAVINGSFTIGFWTDVPSSSSLRYIFGDTGADDFRCFTGGVAQNDSWMMRGGDLPDLDLIGGADGQPHYMYVVYDASAGTYTGYVDGVQVDQQTVSSIPNETGTGFVIGGVKSTGLDGSLDEFRWYGRALTAAEIQATSNVPVDNAVKCSSPKTKVVATVGNAGDKTISSLPYTDSDDTGNFANSYVGSPGSNCGTTDAYLAGNDVVYEYTANGDYILNVDLTGLNAGYTAVFVYTDCADIGNQCAAVGSYAQSSSADHGFQMSVQNGNTYYFVVSSAIQTPTYSYTLEIDGYTCANFPKPAGAASQDYISGQSLADLTVQGSDLTWYTDAALTNPAPDSTLLSNNTTYYVTQTFGTCESSALAVTVQEKNCTVLAVNSTAAFTVCGEGSALLTATGSGAAANTEIYWYDRATGGNPIGRGEEFYTPKIEQTTSYWVAEAAVTGQGSMAPELLYYTFDEGSSITNHASSPVGNNPASIQGNLTVGGSGMVGKALQGTGSSSSSNYVDTGWDTYFTGAFTIGFWVKMDKNISGLKYLFGDSGADSFRCYYSPSGSSYFKPNNGLGTISFTGLDDGNAHYVHFVYDDVAGKLIVYIDGQSVATDNVPTSYTWQKGSGLKIGGYSSSTGLDGKMDEFRIYNRALSQSEIQSTIAMSLGSTGLCESPRKKVVAVVNHVEDITVTEPLPYTDSDNTKNYFNNYSGIPGNDCSTESYLDGYEVIYRYSPSEGGVFSISLSGLTNPDAAIFVYKSCDDIGSDCYAGMVSDGTTSNFGIEEVVMNDGQDYYILIATKESGSTTDYTLTIDKAQIDCADYTAAPEGDAAQYFEPGDSLPNLAVEGANLRYYSNASLDSVAELADTTGLVDGNTYYITQTLNGCVSAPLQVTVTEVNCSGLAITQTQNLTVVCKGVPTLTAQAASVSGNTNIYWYDSPTNGEVVHRGANFQVEDEITQTTSFWVAQVLLNGSQSGPYGFSSPQYGNGSSSTGAGIAFVADKAFTIMSVDVFVESGNGNIEISLVDEDQNTVLESTTVGLPGSGQVTIPLHFRVPGPGNYTLRKTSGSVDLMYEYDYPQISKYPIALGGFGRLTEGVSSYSSYDYYYYYFYNWVVSDADIICESPRKKVTVTVSNDGDEIVNSLPYTDSTSTANYGNSYVGAPGSNCDTADNYFNGSETVYSFVATQDSLINVRLSDLDDFYAGVFIYENCADIGTSCAAGAAAGPSSANMSIEDFEVEAGTKYYIVVSSWLTEAVSYQIDIEYFSCNDVTRPIGDTLQKFVGGDVVSDLMADSTHTGAELHWYTDAGLSNEITDPDNFNLVNGAVYYVTQTFKGCESAALAVEVSEIDCSTLAITSYDVDTVACRGTATIRVNASGTGDEIYWYADSSGTDLVASGNSLETPEITQDTTFWVTEVLLGGESYVSGFGKVAPTGSSSFGSTLNYGLKFNAAKDFTLHSVDVYPDESGDLEISLFDSSGSLLYSKSQSVSASPNSPITIVLNFAVPAGTGYRLLQTSNPSLDLIRDSSGNNYPYNIGQNGEFGQITAGTYGATGSLNSSSYYYFFNWSIGQEDAICESPLKKVTVVVDQSSDFNVDYQDLPYTDADNTALFGNNYAGDPGMGCNGSNYLNGAEVLYHYAADPSNDDILNIKLSNVTNSNAAVFIYKSCGDIGRDCVAGLPVENGVAELNDFYVNAGEEFVIVISSQTGSTGYTLDISGLDCNNVAAPTGDSIPYFVSGEVVADLASDIDTSAYNQGLNWYKDAGLTQPINRPDTLDLVDGQAYYVTQTIMGCESKPFKITPIEFQCSQLSATPTQSKFYVCAPGGEVTLSVDSSGIGSDIYWYDAATGGNYLGKGSSLTVNVSASTSFWAKETFLGEIVYVDQYGKTTHDDTYSSASTLNYGLAFDAYAAFTLHSVDVYPEEAGSLEISLIDASGSIIAQHTQQVPKSPNNPVTVILDFNVPVGTGYKLLQTGSSVLDMGYDSGSTNYPYEIGPAGAYGSIVGYTYSSDPSPSTYSYYYFFNWSVGSREVMCQSNAAEVEVVVNTETTPTPIVSPKHTICGEGLLSDIEVLGKDVQWYTSSGMPISANSPIVQGERYYVTQTIKGCESAMKEVIMEFFDKSAKPVAAINQPFLAGDMLSDLTVQGKNLQWYEDQFMLQPINDPTTVALVDQETYYVTQTRQGECESEPLGITVSLALNVNYPEFAGIKLYPNPVESTLNIENKHSIDHIVIYDMLGREVYSAEYAEPNIQIDFSNFASGTYFIKTRIDNHAQIFKVIKK